MLPERWRKNRDALSKLIGSYIGKRAGDSLVELVQEEYGKADKPGYDLHKADEVFCEVIRKWVAAGAKLLKDADVGVYMDTIDTGQLVNAHLASKPEDRVKTPCAENYPTVLGDRADDDETLWEAHKLRQVEKERTLRQSESGPTRAGECDDVPETPATTPDAAAPGGGGGREATAVTALPHGVALQLESCRSQRRRSWRPPRNVPQKKPSARLPP